MGGMLAAAHHQHAPFITRLQRQSSVQPPTKLSAGPITIARTLPLAGDSEQLQFNPKFGFGHLIMSGDGQTTTTTSATSDCATTTTTTTTMRNGLSHGWPCRACRGLPQCHHCQSCMDPGHGSRALSRGCVCDEDIPSVDALCTSARPAGRARPQKKLHVAVCGAAWACP
jgi:hypothetical protein